MSSRNLWLEKRRAVESEYAAMIGLTREDLETLAELVPLVSRDRVTSAANSGSLKEETCYRARFEAAEQRYARMKALVCASLEAQMRLKSEQKGRFVVETLRELGLGDRMEVETILGQRSLDESSRRHMVEQIWELVSELQCAKKEIVELSKRCVGLPEPMQQEESPNKVNDDIASELAAARKRIAALDMELNRMNEKSFEDDERVRECDDVYDRIMGLDQQIDSDGVHPKYHPMTTCADPACQNYARRLRNGLKQAVAEAYVRERSVRIHGYFWYQVEPMERLRIEKDREIESLRFQLKRLEHATCQSSENVTVEQLEMEKVIRKVEIDTLEMGIKKLKDESRILAAERDRWSGKIACMQEDVRDAEAIIAESQSAKARMQLDAELFETRKAELETLVKQIEEFQKGGMASVYRERVNAVEKLKKEIETMEERLAALQEEYEEETGGEEMTDGVKKKTSLSTRKHEPSLNDNGEIQIWCKCKQWVVLSDLQSHIEIEHTPEGKKPGTQCPNGCGYFVDGNHSSDMNKHTSSQACADRVAEIQRLRERTKPAI